MADLKTIIGGASQLLTNPVGGIVDIFSGLFGGPPEDTSLTGYNNFLAAQGNVFAGTQYPSLVELQQIGNQSGWPSDVMASLGKTYNQNSGTFTHGDWHAAFSNLNPVTIKLFKGAGEVNTLSSSFKYSPAGSTQVPNAGAVSQAAGNVNAAQGPTNAPSDPFQALMASASSALAQSFQAPAIDYNALQKKILDSIAKSNSQEPSNMGSLPGGQKFGVPIWIWVVAGGVLLLLFFMKRRK